MEQMREPAFDRETLEARSAELEEKYQKVSEQAQGILEEIKVLNDTLQRMEMQVELPKAPDPEDARVIEQYNKSSGRQELMIKLRNFRRDHEAMVKYAKLGVFGAVATSGISGIVHDPNIFVQNLLYNSTIGAGVGVAEDVLNWVLYKKKFGGKAHD